MLPAITISIRDLHARTGHFVRKAAEMPVIVTDNGKPVAEIRELAASSKADAKRPYFSRRMLLPGFKQLMESGALRPKPGDKSIDEILDEIRADSTA
jgi:antitoxin (DNA-binding transcriptional repressor) of toxin-antitoxin stability system